MTKRHLGNGELKAHITEYVQSLGREFSSRDVTLAFRCEDIREIAGILRRMHADGIIYRIRKEKNNSIWRCYHDIQKKEE